MVFSQVGECESSKSAMNTLAPELRALMTILRSTGPVISTLRSCRSGGIGATVQSRSRSARDRKSTRLNSSHVRISYAVFCLKKKKNQEKRDCGAANRDT